VLVVDDDLELLELLTTYLRRQGIEKVSVLNDARLLEARLRLVRPDVIVLDVLMPDLDGLTALSRLRASGDEPPVILLTARTEDADRIAGLDAGADAFPGKPFNPRELPAHADAVLRRPK
jgi:two-component system phosphate regulon response regulator OmpR